MNQPAEYRILPELREHDFRSSLPIIGPLISLIRRILYDLTAKWGVWAVIQQQNQINRIIMEELHRQVSELREELHRQVSELREELRNQGILLVNLDQEFTLLARTVAEIEIRQRQQAERGTNLLPERHSDDV